MEKHIISVDGKQFLAFRGIPYVLLFLEVFRCGHGCPQLDPGTITVVLYTTGAAASTDLVVISYAY